MTTHKTFEMVAEIWASQSLKKKKRKKKKDLFNSGNFMSEGNEPSKINQVIVTKYLCQDKGQTKLKTLYPMNFIDRMNSTAGQPELFA